jgi:DNA recombination protein Rad52
MSFTQNQVRKLRAKLKPQHVKTREAEGVALSYLEGWHVVAEANRIFGFDGWDREMISSECVWTKQVNGRYCAAYVARIRIRVRAGEALVTREGSGAGESNAASPGQAHEFAAKAAETDATKRALMTFGNAFGLSLYGGAAEARGKLPNGGAIAPSERHTTSVPVENQQQKADVTGHPMATPNPAASEGGAAPASPPPVGFSHSLPVILPAPDWPHIKALDEAVRMNSDRQERIDKSALAQSEPKRIRNSGHLLFVASKPCLVCGRNRAHAHHLKFAQPTALGRKVSDEFTVPLCSTHHRELHRYGDERTWWTQKGIDPLARALELWFRTIDRPVSAADLPAEPDIVTEDPQKERLELPDAGDC